MDNKIDIALENERSRMHLCKLRIEAFERKWEILQDIISSTPNDSDLGKIIRQTYTELKK